MSIKTRIEKIEKKLEPKEEIKIIVTKDGDDNLPDDYCPDIIISGDRVERYTKH